MVTEAGSNAAAAAVSTTHIISSTNIDAVGSKANISNFIVEISLIASEFSCTSVKVIR